MSKSVIFLMLLLIGLAIALLAPVDLLDSPTKEVAVNLSPDAPEEEVSDPVLQSITAENPADNSRWAKQLAAQLRHQLAANQYRQAVTTITENYVAAQASELAWFKSIVIAHAATLMGSESSDSAVLLLEVYTEQFDDLDAWRMLAMVYVRTKQWPDALRVLKKTTAQENDPSRYVDSLNALDTAAGNVAAELKRQNDVTGILSLYRELFELFPQHARFQLGFGRALAAIGDVGQARQQFAGLLYQPDIGLLAQQEIDNIDALQNNSPDEPETDSNVASLASNQIVIPLIRAGNSLIVNSHIEGEPVRLLLDTGASITALSSTMIARLNLAPTGQSIRLNTANGVTESRLFSADELNFGRVTFANVTIAEIEMSNESQIGGLLGTDILRRMTDRYSYIIDDERDALIFNAR